jgi:hypothetical protein
VNPRQKKGFYILSLIRDNTPKGGHFCESFYWRIVNE